MNDRLKPSPSVSERSASAYRSVGFPVSGLTPAASAQTEPAARHQPEPARSTTAKPSISIKAPAPKRPKGRLFISTVILSVVGFVCWSVWNEFLRFEAYGTITGRVIQVAAPWSGTVKSLNVKDGEYVRQGQLLATLDNTELSLRVGKLRDEIVLAHANFEARVAELRASKREIAESILRLHVDYFQMVSEYHQQRARLDDLRSTHLRLEKLGTQQAVSTAEVESAKFALEGQLAKVEESGAAVETMKQGLTSVGITDNEEQLFRLEKTKLATLVADWERLVEYQTLGEIRAPVSGRIVQRHHFTGEYVSASDTVFELLEDGSLEAVLYLPQHKADELSLGERTRLVIPSESEPIAVEIRRFADQMAPAPPNIARYYRANARLVAVYATPLPGSLGKSEGVPVRLGAEVRVPRMRWLPNFAVSANLAGTVQLEEVKDANSVR